MPIRPENRDRYPADWKVISLRIRTERAGGRCECDGRCGSVRHTSWAGVRRRLGRSTRCPAYNGEVSPLTGSLVVLTVAHLDHQPEHSTDDNLMAMCQSCHLNYDREHHAATRRSSMRQPEQSLLW